MKLKLMQVRQNAEGVFEVIREFTKPASINSLITPEEELQEIYEFPILANFKFWVDDEVVTYDGRYGTVSGIDYDEKVPTIYNVTVRFYCDDGSSYDLVYQPSELTRERRFSLKFLKATK